MFVSPRRAARFQQARRRSVFATGRRFVHIFLEPWNEKCIREALSRGPTGTTSIERPVIGNQPPQALILREVMGQANPEEFIQLADSCVELCRGSFFGEAAVLGHPSRLETIVTTRSSTMMTLGVHDMSDLCQLSFEFKAKLCIIAFERMRRNRTSREIVECCAREFGLDPDDFVAGTERAEAGTERAGRLVSDPNSGC